MTRSAARPKKRGEGRDIPNEILYRKWRPRTFAELAGQEHVAQTLTNALTTGRVAHAYLFAGPRGTGKTSTGRLLGKALNCTDRRNGEPCNACESCLAFLAGRAMDLIELDAASNRGIDEIRSLRDKVAYAPSGEFKVYLIDEVHMLTEAAFNALLKTLEEPPPHVVFILATTEAHKLPATIASRCQRFDFRRIPVAAAVATLERIAQGEGITCEPEALELIARSATGSLRDATNLLDQLATSYGKQLTLEHVRTGLGLIGDERSGHLARFALAGDLGGGLSLIASIRDDGLDLRQFQRELVDELRALLMVKSGLEPEDGATAERLSELKAAVAPVSVARILAALRAFGEADLKTDPNSTLPLDIALAECVLADTPAGAAVAGPEGTAAARPRADATGMPSAPVSAGSTGSPRTGGLTPPPTGASAESASSPVSPGSPAGSRPGPPPPSAHPEALEGPESLEEQAAGEHSPAPPTTNGGVSPSPIVERGSGGEVSLAALRDQMRPIYTSARARSAPLGALLNSGCDIIKVVDREVTFGFRFPNHAAKASERANLEALAAVLLEVTGQQLTVVCSQEADLTDWKQREGASRNPLVRAAEEMGARIITPREGPTYTGLTADPEDLQ